MKKYLLIAGMIAFICSLAPASVKAQWAVPKQLTTTAFGNALDTVDNTEQHVTTTLEGRVGTWKTGITGQCIVKKISGTVGGTLAFQGSMDGTEWVTIGTATTPSDASANYGFNTVVRYYYYRISWTGAGTMSASMKCQLFAY
jgi:TRAP-type mannitol/chloroaromatic compound transport system substrate-binding protein